MSSYGAIGTSPLRDISKRPEKLLVDYLKANYDPTATTIPYNNIKWEQWGISQGDYAVYLQQTGHFNVSTEISGTFLQYDHYIEIHVFARSLHDDYDKSALKQLFLIDNWVRKLITQNPSGLSTEGINGMWVQDTREVPTEDATDDIRRFIITVYMQIEMVNNLG